MAASSPSYAVAVAGGVGDVAPVDLHLRGRPPTPPQVLQGLLALLDR